MYLLIFDILNKGVLWTLVFVIKCYLHNRVKMEKVENAHGALVFIGYKMINIEKIHIEMLFFDWI